MNLSGWGRYPVLDGTLNAPRDEAELAARVAEGYAIARGNGRAYGDSAVSRSNTISMRRFDRMLAFDPATGQLVAEAGVLLGDMIAAFLPRGWFPMVTPGTKFVTLGGMIAADVHGKNHHVDGSMGAHVDWVDVMDGDGVVHRCSREEDPERFEWTLGGMGLTGIVLRAAIRLRSIETGWIQQTTIPAPDLDAAISTFEDNLDATYSVAWIDCLARGARLGRSLVMLGEHAPLTALPPAQRRDRWGPTPRAKRTLPFDLPTLALNRLSVRAMNEVYWRIGLRGAGRRLVGWDGYFYPLDAILGWNRIYGRKGFLQYQCVLPLEGARAGLTALLEEIAATGSGSFLAVLKRFGAQTSRISFPMEGYTLALDFPIRPATLDLARRLDQIVLARGGRFYLAKDAHLTPASLRASDPRIDALAARRAEAGIDRTFRSAQAERLSL